MLVMGQGRDFGVDYGGDVLDSGLTLTAHWTHNADQQEMSVKIYLSKGKNSPSKLSKQKCR